MHVTSSRGIDRPSSRWRRIRHALWNARDSDGDSLGRLLEVDLPISLQKNNPRDALSLRLSSLAHSVQLSSFRRSYEGCCGGALFAWSYWTWSPFGTGNGPWVDTLWTYLSDEVIGSTGACPFNDGGVIL